MKTFIIYPTDSQLNGGSFLNSDDSFVKATNFQDIHDFETLSHKDVLIYLLPSSLINSYRFEQNKNLSNQNNIANFISEIDVQLINEVSANEFFIINDLGFVIDRVIYKKINSLLSALRCKVILLPDYFLNQKNDLDMVTEFNKKFLFSFSDRTGTSIEADSLEQYLDIINYSLPEFNPIISVQDKKAQKLLGGHKRKASSNLFQELAIKDFNSLPNLFKFNISFKNIIKKMNFKKLELYAFGALMALMIATPYTLIALNNNYEDIYKQETFNLFKKLDKNTKRVVTPKLQIDQLINQIPDSYQTYNNEDNFKNLEFLTSLGEQFIDKVEIDFNTNSAKITLKSMPEIQYNLIRNIVSKFNITILDEDITLAKNLASGLITIEFKQ